METLENYRNLNKTLKQKQLEIVHAFDDCYQTIKDSFREEIELQQIDYEKNVLLLSLPSKGTFNKTLKTTKTNYNKLIKLLNDLETFVNSIPLSKIEKISTQINKKETEETKEVEELLDISWSIENAYYETFATIRENVYKFLYFHSLGEVLKEKLIGFIPQIKKHITSEDDNFLQLLNEVISISANPSNGAQGRGGKNVMIKSSCMWVSKETGDMLGEYNRNMLELFNPYFFEFTEQGISKELSVVGFMYGFAHDLNKKNEELSNKKPTLLIKLKDCFIIE